MTKPSLDPSQAPLLLRMGLLMSLASQLGGCLSPAASLSSTTAGPSTTGLPRAAEPYAPATEREWIQKETRATELAAEGGFEAGAPQRLLGDQLVATHTISAQAETCYRVGIAATGTLAVNVEIQFGRGPEGPVNAQLGATSQRFEGSGGAAAFCADAPGEVVLHVTALDERGAVSTRPLHLAVATGARREAPEEAAGRRTREAKAASDATFNRKLNRRLTEQKELQDLCKARQVSCMDADPAGACGQVYDDCMRGD